MNDVIKHAEILAPAGGEDQLVAAVRCGADAVYLGVGAFNARRGAKNFDREGLCRAAEYCRERGVRVFAALNTLFTDSEIGAFTAELDAAAEAGVDAVIVQDLAAAALVRRRWPELPLHASTQLCVHNAEGAARLEKLGFSQVVLARELSLGEIRQIREKCGVALEVFVHGALCMCVSGACYLSSVIGARSGNRGLCAQPCRTDFKLGGRHFALSLKDLCGIEHIAELEKIGVKTFKIEGRMKRPEYVAAAVSAYKAAQRGEQPDVDLLRRAFSRSGFTDGYLTGRRDHTMFGSRTKDDVTAMQSVLPSLAALYAREPQRVPVDMSLTLKSGAPASLNATDGVNTVSVTGAIPTETGRAADAEAFRASLSKTGGTPYYLNSLAAEIGEGLSLPASERNQLRRSALEELSSLRRGFAGYKKSEESLPALPPHTSAERLALRLRFESAKQAFLPDGADEIVLPIGELIADPRTVENFHGRVIAELPALCFEADAEALSKRLERLKQLGINDVLGGNIGYVEAAARHGLTLHGDYGFNVINSVALSELERMGLADVTLSFELKLSRALSLGGSVRRGIIGYGYLPLMKLRACPAKGEAGCGNCRGMNTTTDSKGAKFALVCREKRYTELLNGVPLYIADKPFSGVDFVTLRFTTETKDEAESIFRAFTERRPPSFPRTCGLYYRELL